MSDDDARPEPPPRQAPQGGQRAWELWLEGRIQALVDRAVDRAAPAAPERPVSGGDVPDLAERVEKLAFIVDRLLGVHDRAPPPFAWDDLDDDDYAKRRAELDHWVEHVLRRWHPRHAKALRPCWAAHPGAFAALTAAWLAWAAAYRDPKRKGSDPADWIGRHLPVLERELKADLDGCDPLPPDRPDDPPACALDRREPTR